MGSVITPDPDEICGLDVDVNGSYFEAEAEVVGGSYQMQLPAGTHYIYLDSGGNGPYDLVAYPVQVTVTPSDIVSGTPVDAPDIIAISKWYSTYGTISGAVTKNSGADPTGQLMIGILPAGSLDDVTPDKLARVELIQEMRLGAFEPYALFPVPPVPPGAYDVFCALDNQAPNGLDSVTILGWHKNVIVGPDETVTNIDFDYTHSGSNYIDGYVTSNFGNPILNAQVLVKDIDGNLIGFAVTDPNGYYRIYNLPAGGYTMAASQPEFEDTETPINIPADTTKNLVLDYTSNNGPTHVGSNITSNTTWDVAGSPYIVDGGQVCAIRRYEHQRHAGGRR